MHAHTCLLLRSNHTQLNYVMKICDVEMTSIATGASGIDTLTQEFNISIS